MLCAKSVSSSTMSDNFKGILSGESQTLGVFMLSYFISGRIYFGWVTETNGKASILKQLLQTYSTLHQLRLSLLIPSSLNEPNQMRFGQKKN